MFDFTTIILITTVAIGLYMAWNIGANDVANAMGTSVGSKALTLKQAVLIAAVLEFAGAFLVGSHVTDTVRKGIIDPQIFLGEPQLLMFGMMGALMAAAVWLQLATYFGLPVSTTHSIVGAIVGFALVGGGADAVNWMKVSKIVGSWIISPLLGGIIAFTIFNFIKRQIFFKRDPIEATRRVAPLLVFLVFFILTLVMAFKGLKQLNLDLSFQMALVYATGIGIVASFISSFCISKYLSNHQPKTTELSLEDNTLISKLNDITLLLEDSKQFADDRVLWRLKKVKRHLSTCIEETKLTHSEDNKESSYLVVEKVFVFLQILSACFVAFAHGANDVANAIGPMAAVISIAKTNTVLMQVPVPLWVLGIGGLGIVVGLATWGWRVIETIGKKITELTPTRGFAAEFGAATTIVIASKLGLPISTTHTLVGSVLGVGMARGMASLNISVIRNILLSWFITLPAGGILSILFYWFFQSVFQ